ncbi:tegument protein [Murid herpesvirus 3]|uniref:Tegument protein n=2 Tax=Murid betaherpesvirus 3 TaxID=2560603 RepID=A0A1P8VIY9_9BETA|nr:tegument protein [Murine roseolovirus]APZ76297.1 tegument protein [Murid betaherpesvirus 3]AYH64807.1 tegument protein [Murid herpesvirus 3]
MSQKDFLKSAMLKNLQTNQTKRMYELFGKDHPLSVCQHLVETRDSLKAQNVESTFVNNAYVEIFEKEKIQNRIDKQNITKIKRIDIDDIMITKTEVKDALDDIKEAISTRSESDLVI